MITTIQRRAVLMPVLVLLVAAWVLAANPLLGRGALELCDPEAVEELLEGAEEIEQEQLMRLPVIIGSGHPDLLQRGRPCLWDEACSQCKGQPQEHLLGHCSICRAPPRGENR